MPSTKSKRRRLSLEGRFVPRFFDELDRRSTIYKEVTERLQRLLVEAGVDSYQKELLAQEAIFISVMLETKRVKAAETGEFDEGSYTQMVNALSGLLNKLGLRREHVGDVVTLDDYVESKS